MQNRSRMAKQRLQNIPKYKTNVRMSIAWLSRLSSSDQRKYSLIMINAFKCYNLVLIQITPLFQNHLSYYSLQLQFIKKFQFLYAMSSQRKYTVIVQWFDPAASLIRQFYFTYYLPNHQIQMHDMKNHKVFLKKIHYPQITVNDLYIGNILPCYGRQLKIVDFGDEFTKKNLAGQSVSNKTYGMIKPDSYLNIGKIISHIQKDFIIGNLKMFRMAKKNAQNFYAEHHGKQFFPKLIQFMTSDFAVGLQLIAPDAINRWRKTLGPTNSEKAKKQAPQSIRANFGTDGTKNACHGSDSPQSAERELGYIFSSQNLKSQPYLSNCSLCIIKPHIIKNKELGKIINEILQAGFQISAMQMIWLDPAVAEEFYQVYKFLPESKRMIDHLSSGPCVALEVRQQNAVEQFRTFCGPYDPQIGKKLQPKSLRARYGVDRVLNAVHCTDLPEDGALEVHFIFDTLIG